MMAQPRPIRFSSTAKFITAALLVIGAIWLLRTAWHIVTPFIAAGITAYLFNPLIRWLSARSRLGRAFWITMLYILAGLLIYALIYSFGPALVAQYREFVAQVPAIINTVTAQISATEVIQIGAVTFNVGPLEQPVVDFLTDIGRSLPETLPHLVGTAIESVVLFVTYLMVTFYLLLQADQIVERGFGLVPAPYRAEIRNIGRQIDGVLAGYIRGTLLLIPIMAVLTYIALTILGVRYALVVAIASGFLEIIPLLGPWSAAGIAMTVALFQPTVAFGWENWVLALVVGVTYFVLRMFEDNFIIPQVLGHTVHMHPVIVLFAILAGGAIGGPFGLLVAIPVAGVVQVIVRYLYRKLVDSPEPPEPPAVAVVPPVREGNVGTQPLTADEA